MTFAWLIACDAERSDIEQPADDWPTGLISPIEGATFSLARSHLPGAARTYRNGTHKGFDFFSGLSGPPLADDEPILAIADGVIVRIDHDHEDSEAEAPGFWAELASEPGFLGAFALDRLRGRQVWVRHEYGHISRYAHLSMVHPELQPGDAVEQGQVIGLMGNSGVPAAADGAEPPPHLHFELWVPDGSRYLGQGLDPLQTHLQVAQSFGSEALPAYARRIIARIDAGSPAPDPYPPEELPQTEFQVDPPSSLTVGVPFAAAVTWEGEDFSPDSLFAFFDHQPLGILDAGNGAWLLGALPPGSEGNVRNLIIGGTDQYGQSMHGAQPVEALSGQPDVPHLEVPREYYERHTDENRHAESMAAGHAALESLSTTTPMWSEPFQAPANGEVIRAFGQSIYHGLYRSDHPAPGLWIRLDSGDSVFAANSGTVSRIESLPIRGRAVFLVHGGGVVSVYSNLEEVLVEPGETVEVGQQIAASARSEIADGLILGWEMHIAGVPTDPVQWLDQVLPGMQDHQRAR